MFKPMPSAVRLRIDVVCFQILLVQRNWLIDWLEDCACLWRHKMFLSTAQCLCTCDLYWDTDWLSSKESHVEFNALLVLHDPQVINRGSKEMLKWELHFVFCASELWMLPHLLWLQWLCFIVLGWRLVEKIQRRWTSLFSPLCFVPSSCAALYLPGLLNLPECLTTYARC